MPKRIPDRKSSSFSFRISVTLSNGPRRVADTKDDDPILKFERAIWDSFTILRDSLRSFCQNDLSVGIFALFSAVAGNSLSSTDLFSFPWISSTLC